MTDETTTPIRLDDTDLLILQLLYNQDRERRHLPRYSLWELNDAIPQFRSIATIHARISRLENAGLVFQPARKVPRSRTITDKGIERLKNALGLPVT